MTWTILIFSMTDCVFIIFSFEFHKLNFLEPILNNKPHGIARNIHVVSKIALSKVLLTASRKTRWPDLVKKIQKLLILKLSEIYNNSNIFSQKIYGNVANGVKEIVMYLVFVKSVVLHLINTSTFSTHFFYTKSTKSVLWKPNCAKKCH